MATSFFKLNKFVFPCIIVALLCTGCFTMMTYERVGCEKAEIDNWSFSINDSGMLEVKAKVNFTYYYLPFDFDLDVPCACDAKEFVALLPVKPAIVPAGRLHAEYPHDYDFERGICAEVAENDERLCRVKVVSSPCASKRFSIHSSGLPIWGTLYTKQPIENNSFKKFSRELCIEYHPDDKHFLSQPFIYSDKDEGMALMMPLHEEDGRLYCVGPYINSRSLWNFGTSEHKIRSTGMEFYRVALTPLTLCLDIVTSPVQLVWFCYQMASFQVN